MMTQDLVRLASVKVTSIVVGYDILNDGYVARAMSGDTPVGEVIRIDNLQMEEANRVFKSMSKEIRRTPDGNWECILKDYAPPSHAQ